MGQSSLPSWTSLIELDDVNARPLTDMVSPPSLWARCIRGLASKVSYRIAATPQLFTSFK
jgi:hypothetical protein